jgi:hypothetical protein
LRYSGIERISELILFDKLNGFWTNLTHIWQELAYLSLFFHIHISIKLESCFELAMDGNWAG